MTQELQKAVNKAIKEHFDWKQNKILYALHLLGITESYQSLCNKKRIIIQNDMSEGKRIETYFLNKKQFLTIHEDIAPTLDENNNITFVRGYEIYNDIVETNLN